MNQIIQPAQIEKTSFAIITKELGNRTFPDGQAEVVKRVIHTTADFDRKMHFPLARMRFKKGQP